MTWKEEWVKMFPSLCTNQETKVIYNGKPIIADAKINKTLVMLQDGIIEEGKVLAIEKRYRDMIWIINTSRVINRFDFGNCFFDSAGFKLLLTKRKISVFKRTIALDFGVGDKVFLLTEYDVDRMEPPVMQGKGMWVSKKKLIESLTINIKPRGEYYVISKPKKPDCPSCGADNFYLSYNRRRKREFCTVCQSLLQT